VCLWFSEVVKDSAAGVPAVDVVPVRTENDLAVVAIFVQKALGADPADDVGVPVTHAQHRRADPWPPNPPTDNSPPGCRVLIVAPAPTDQRSVRRCQPIRGGHHCGATP